MRTYVLKRLLLMIPTLVGLTLLTYFIVRLAPGDPIEAMIRVQSGDINPEVMAEEAEAIRERLGLNDYNLWGDDPDHIDPPEKILNAFYGYARWIGHMVRGDFGESIKFVTGEGSKSPPALFAERASVTFLLNVFAQAFIFLIAIPVGLASAQYRGRVFDRSATFVLLVLWSIPIILAGTLMIGLLARGGTGVEWFPYGSLHSDAYVGYKIFPERAEEAGLGEYLATVWAHWGESGPPTPDASLLGYLRDLLWHVTLPVTCLVYGGLAYLAKLGRASLLENLRADYVRTARAKGLPERRVVYRHALRNSLIPMITVMVMMLPALIGGSVLVETIFTIRGMGSLMIGAALAQDLSVIMFGALVFGTLTLMALLAGDLLYAWADPRVRFEE